MITNADITIYNHHVNGEKKCEEYLSTVIRGVNWYTNQKINVQDGAIQSVDLYKIRIPETANTEEKTYINPDKFLLLPDDVVKQYWTIENGDLFIKGISDMSYQDLIKGDNQKACKVKSWSDNRRGFAPHFRIGGA